jgi:hypothetical protein
MEKSSDIRSASNSTPGKTVMYFDARLNRTRNSGLHRVFSEY